MLSQTAVQVHFRICWLQQTFVPSFCNLINAVPVQKTFVWFARVHLWQFCLGVCLPHECLHHSDSVNESKKLVHLGQFLSMVPFKNTLKRHNVAYSRQLEHQRLWKAPHIPSQLDHNSALPQLLSLLYLLCQRQKHQPRPTFPKYQGVLILCTYAQLAGVRCGLAVAGWIAKWEGRSSKPGHSRNLDPDFCFKSTPTPPLGPQASGYQSPSQAGNSLMVRKRGSSERVQILRS